MGAITTPRCATGELSGPQLRDRDMDTDVVTGTICSLCQAASLVLGPLMHCRAHRLHLVRSRSLRISIVLRLIIEKALAGRDDQVVHRRQVAAFEQCGRCVDGIRCFEVVTQKLDVILRELLGGILRERRKAPKYSGQRFLLARW